MLRSVGIGAPENGCRGIDRLKFFLLNVLRNVDDDGPWATAFGEMEGLLKDARKIVRIHHEVGVLDDRQSHAEEVGLLKGHFTNVFGEYLAGDGNEGD